MMMLIFFQIGNLKHHYHIEHDLVPEIHLKHHKEKTDLLMLEKEVKWAKQQTVLHRFKRHGIPIDPLFKDMWYLVSTTNSYPVILQSCYWR